MIPKMRASPSPTWRATSRPTSTCFCGSLLLLPWLKSIITRAGSSDQTLSAGFSIAGGAKPLLIRGAGPALAAFSVTDNLLLPQLKLFNQSTQQVILTNNGWDQASNSEAVRTTGDAVGAFPFLPNSGDTALLTTLNDGVYSAQITGANDTTGKALVELYDADPNGSARLINISARSFIGTGADILAAGFVISGTEEKTLLIRGVGPTLGAFGIAGYLPDPKLTILRHNADGSNSEVVTNTGWGTTDPAGLDAARAATNAFALTTDSLDSAVVVPLTPGTYYAQVSGASGSTGVGLVEVYEIR